MKSKLFAVAAESLIDQAEQANQNTDSINPQAQQSAVDFDAELRRLNGEAQSSEPAADLNTPDGGTDGSGDTGGGDLDLGGDTGGADLGADMGNGDVGAAAATDDLQSDASTDADPSSDQPSTTEADAAAPPETETPAETADPVAEPAAKDAPVVTEEPVVEPTPAPAEEPPTDTPEPTPEPVVPAADPTPAETPEPVAEEPVETDASPEAPADSKTQEPAEDDPANTDEDGEVDPTEATEPLPDEADLKKAAEGIQRLTRCLQNIENAHDCGVITPVMATVAHAETNAVIADLGLDVEAVSRPAFEKRVATTESDRLQEIRTRLKTVLAAAWKKFLEWVAKVQRWTQEFRRGYNAKRGIYEKTAAGYAVRLKALQRSPQAGELKHTIDSGTAALAHQSRLTGVDSLVEAGQILSTVSHVTARACFAVDIRSNLGSIVKVFMGLSTGPQADAMDEFKGLDLQKAFNATVSSDVISAANPTLTHEFAPPDVGQAGYLRVGGIPGGLSLDWAIGNADYFQSLNEAVRATAQNNFTLTRTQDTDSHEAFDVDLQATEKLLGLYLVMSKSTAELLNVLNSVEQALAIATRHTAGVTKIVSDSNKDAAASGGTSLNEQEIQDVVRLYSMLTAAYERTIASPVHALVRAQNSAQEMVLRFVGAALTTMDQQLKGVDPTPK